MKNCVICSYDKNNNIDKIFDGFSQIGGVDNEMWETCLGNAPIRCVIFPDEVSAKFAMNWINRKDAKIISLNELLE